MACELPRASAAPGCAGAPARYNPGMSPHAEHHFACNLLWTGASRGPIRDYDSYSREHRLEVPGKPAWLGSSAPVFRGDGALTNPEDLLVAALSSCHFLSYAALCARGGVELRAYQDAATGVMAIDPKRKVLCFREVVLRPRCLVAPGADLEKAMALHGTAHAQCFIANSVNFEVRHEPVVELG